jgi:hypothetical protein
MVNFSKHQQLKFQARSRLDRRFRSDATHPRRIARIRWLGRKTRLCYPPQVLDFPRVSRAWRPWRLRHWPNCHGNNLKTHFLIFQQVVNHPKFLEHPHECAKFIWEKSGGDLAANGAVMRTSILGIVQFHDLDKVIENTKEICKVFISGNSHLIYR